MPLGAVPPDLIRRHCSKLGLYRDAVVPDTRRPPTALITEKAPALTRLFFAAESAKLRLAAVVSYRRFGQGLSNVFVIRLIGEGRTIANNEVKV
jgi:hypothetical protein